MALFLRGEGITQAATGPGRTRREQRFQDLDGLLQDGFEAVHGGTALAWLVWYLGDIEGDEMGAMDALILGRRSVEVGACDDTYVGEAAPVTVDGVSGRAGLTSDEWSGSSATLEMCGTRALLDMCRSRY